MANRKKSPYRNTPTGPKFMGYYEPVTFEPSPDDLVVKIEDHSFVERPDLLANSVYGDPDLWWVFGVRNGWEDPIHDLQYGMDVYMPNPSVLR